MEKVANMRVTAGCKLAFGDYVSAEAQTEIANELRMGLETTTRTESEQSFTQQVTHEMTDSAYTVAMWTVVDLFTLCRADRYPIRTWEFVHGEDYLEVDVSPPAATAGGDGHAFDPDSFNLSLDKAPVGQATGTSG